MVGLISKLHRTNTAQRRTCSVAPILGAILLLSAAVNEVGADEMPCFDLANPQYETRQEANARLRQCFPVGSSIEAFVEEFTQARPDESTEQRVHDSLTDREIDAFAFDKRVQRTTGHVDKWVVVGLVEIGTRKIAHVEVLVGLDPKGFSGRSIPFDPLNFDNSTLEIALWSYISAASRNEIDVIMHDLGGTKVDDESRVARYIFQSDEVTLLNRIAHVENYDVVRIDFDSEGQATKIKVR